MYESLTPQQKVNYHYAQALEWRVLGYNIADGRNACFGIANQHDKWAEGIYRAVANEIV